MAEKSNHLFVDAGDLADPEVVAAIATLRREGVKTASGLPLTVITVGPGTEKPATTRVLVVPKEHMSKSHIWQALDAVVQRNPGVILRDDREVPTGSVEAAVERGFDKSEIEQHLMPWIKAARDNASQLVAEKEKELEAAKAELAASFAPQVDAKTPIWIEGGPDATGQG